MKSIELILGIVMATFLVLAGCNDDPAPPPNENIIGSSGGEVKSENDEVSVTIPAGALAADVEITVEETTSHPADNIGTVYDLGPDGTTFSVPVSLTFSYEDSDLPADTDEGDLIIAFAENGVWVPLESNVVDGANNTVTATTTHFTPFAIILPEEEEEPLAGMFYDPASYAFALNNTVSTVPAALEEGQNFSFRIVEVEPDFVTENFTINPETGVVTAQGLTDDASVIEVMISAEDEEEQQVGADTLVFSLATLAYTPETTSFFPGSVFDSGTPSATNLAGYDYAEVVLSEGLTGSEFDINGETGQITGTIGAEVAPGSYSLTVVVLRDERDALDFTNVISIMVEAVDPPSDLSYSPEVTTLFPGDVFDSGMPSISGEAPFVYTLEAIPAGLGSSEFNMNTETGQFTGTIANDATEGTYAFAVTVVNQGGTVTFPEVVSLTVDIIDPPANLMYTPATTTLAAGEAFDSGVPTVSGDAPFSFVLEQTAAGLGTTQLTIDPATGQITGTISDDAMVGTYSLDVTVGNDGGEVTFDDVVVFTVEEAMVSLPETLSYSISGDFFTYTGAPTAQISIVEGSDANLSYSLTVLPSVTAGLSIDTDGNILINDGLLAANDPGFYTLSVEVSNGTESKTFEEVAIVRSFNPSGAYLLEYNPRFSEISAFNPEVLSASTNALFEPPNGPTFSIVKIYNQLEEDFSSIAGSVVTIAADGDLTFTVTSPNDALIADNFNKFYVDVRVNGSSGDVTYRAVAVFGPE